jgi:hypothetical protein
MSEILLADVLQAIGICGAPNTPNVDAGNYHAFLANVQPPQLPVFESISDEEMVGDGYSQTIRNLRNTYWSNKPWNVAGLLNDHIASILLNGWQGGTVTTTPRTSPSKDIAAVMNVINSSPKLFSLFRKLGGEEFLHSTMAPNTFSIAQEGEADPTMNFDLINTGHHLDADELEDEEFDPADILAAPEYEYFHGAATEVTATDGVETYNWTADGSLISLSVEGNRNVDIRRRPGDSFRTVGDHNSGAFARKIRNARPTAGIRLKVDLGASLREYKAMVAKRKLTGLTIVFNGYNKIGVGTDDYEFEIKAPKSQFQMIEGDTDQDFGALSLNIQPLRDSVTKGYYVNRTRTSKTLI